MREGNSFSYTAKSCLEPKNCEPGPFSLTYAHNVTVRVNIACCDTDGCNAGAIPEGNSFSYMVKSCLEPKNCEPGPFSLTYVHNVTERVNIACCNTDGCNAGAIPVPTVSSVPNGRQCLSFFKLDRFDRQLMGIMACTGAEDHCVQESGILTVGGITVPKAVGGCASPGACVKRVGERKYAQGLVEMLSWAECYPAPWASGGIGEP
ncbi:hypothetical protein UY3_02910 [Chelonia mydas]|uniref:UPAR/Ly6 domain-containing protein n=1 Tax=Chelonia mydas TaxID=8469 RepID=M7BVN8_CHEMY|nr:hypothetical protein UY3_02910 [Chelonia mydas]